MKIPPADRKKHTTNNGESEFLSGLAYRMRLARATRGMTRRILSRDSGVSERYLAQLADSQAEGAPSKASGPGGHFTAQRAQARPSKSPLPAPPQSSGWSKPEMDPQLEAVSAEYEREIAALKQELLDLSQRQRRVGARDGATSSISSAPSEGEGGLRAETLPQAEAEIARLNLALQHARQLQAATEATARSRQMRRGGEKGRR